MQNLGFMLMLLALPSYLTHLSHGIISLVECFQVLIICFSSTAQTISMPIWETLHFFWSSVKWVIASQISGSTSKVCFTKGPLIFLQLAFSGLLCRVTESKTKTFVGKNSYFKDKRKNMFIVLKQNLHLIFCFSIFIFAFYNKDLACSFFNLPNVCLTINIVNISAYIYNSTYTFYIEVLLF